MKMTTLIRRDFLATLIGAAACGATVLESDDASAAVPSDIDQPRAPAADLGSLFPQVAQLTNNEEFKFSFLQSRFTDWDPYRAQARDLVFDAFAYRPAPVEPQAEVV